MVNVTENYKLMEIDGEEKKVNTSEAWNVFEFEYEDKITTVNEGDTIEFVVESGELKTGVILKASGKGEKTKIKIVPTNTPCEEIWSVMDIQEGTFKVIKKREEV